MSAGAFTTRDGGTPGAGSAGPAARHAGGTERLPRPALYRSDGNRAGAGQDRRAGRLAGRSPAAAAAMLGGGRWSQTARDQIARFAERFALPVATSYRRGHLFDQTHGNYAGDLGLLANPKLVARGSRTAILRDCRRRAPQPDQHAGLHPVRQRRDQSGACLSRRRGNRAGSFPHASGDPRLAARPVLRRRWIAWRRASCRFGCTAR